MFYVLGAGAKGEGYGGSRNQPADHPRWNMHRPHPVLILFDHPIGVTGLSIEQQAGSVQRMCEMDGTRPWFETREDALLTMRYIMTFPPRA